MPFVPFKGKTQDSQYSTIQPIHFELQSWGSLLLIEKLSGAFVSSLVPQIILNNMHKAGMCTYLVSAGSNYVKKNPYVRGKNSRFRNCQPLKWQGIRGCQKKQGLWDGGHSRLCLPEFNDTSQPISNHISGPVGICSCFGACG